MNPPLSIQELAIIAAGVAALYGVLWLSFLKTDPRAEQRDKAAQFVTDTLIRRAAARSARRQAEAAELAAARQTAEAWPTSCPRCADLDRPEPTCPTCQGHGSPQAADVIKRLRLLVFPGGIEPAPLAQADDLERLRFEVERRHYESWRPGQHD